MQFSKQCTSVGGYPYADNFVLYVDLTDTNSNPQANTSVVTYDVYVESSGSGSIDAIHELYFALNGQVIKSSTENVHAESPNAYIQIAQGSMTIQHDPNGAKRVSFEAGIEATGYGIATYPNLSGEFDLIPIPRGFSQNPTTALASKTLTTATFNWTTSETADIIWYDLFDRNGNLIYSSGEISVWGTSGQYTITSMSPNTPAKTRVRARRAGTSTGGTSATIDFSTYPVATISCNDWTHGDNLSTTITNPSGASTQVAIYKGTEVLCNYRNASGSYTFQFTDTELDNIYRKYGDSSTQTLRVYVKTTQAGVDYYSYIERTITLTGNQKTIRINANGWKRGKAYTNVSGTWKKAVMWTNVNGTWRRTI